MRARHLAGFADELTGPFDVLFAIAVREEAVRTDTDKATRQNMREKAMHELLPIHAAGLQLLSMTIVAPEERDPVILIRFDPVVRDGDAVRVLSEILE